jgi:hypothetical protein
MNAGIRRLTASLLTALLVIPLPPARAEIVETAAAMAAHRQRFAAFLERDDVRRQLEARGIDAAQAKARIEALTDEEAALIAAQFETLPAGGARADVVFYMVAIIILLPLVLVVGTVALVVSAINKSAASTNDQAGEQQ